MQFFQCFFIDRNESFVSATNYKECWAGNAPENAFGEIETSATRDDRFDLVGQYCSGPQTADLVSARLDRFL